MMTVISTRIAQRFDKLDNWTAKNPTLISGELAIVSAQNQTRFKVGDGVHKFNDLPFVDQTQLSTLSAYASVVSAGSLAVGYKNEAAPQSLAVGSNVSAKAQHSIALGNKAATSSLDSFVFNGDNSYLAQPYYDHGEGTFNVNVPLSGIWIQEESLDKVLAVPGMFKTLQLIKPWSENRLHVRLVAAENDQYQSPFLTIDSEVSGALFKSFASSEGQSAWLSCPPAGFTLESNDSPVYFDFGSALAAAGKVPTITSQYFVRYEWYWKDEQNVEHASDTFAAVIPSNTEAGANANDVVNKKQFAELKALLFPDYNAAPYDDAWILALDTYSQMSADFYRSSQKIILSAYTPTAPYKFQMQLSNGQDISSVSSTMSVLLESLGGSIAYSQDLTEQFREKLAEAMPKQSGELSIDGTIENGRIDLYVDNHLVIVSSKEDAKYIESEDGTQRIYGNGDVNILSSAPGTYGAWTDEEGNVDNTWRVVEISAGVFCYVHGDDQSYRSIDTWTSREEAENAKTFSTNYGNVWTKPYIPGAENWVKEGELALKSDIPNGLATQEYVDQKISNLSDEYQPKGNYLTSHQSLGNYYTKTQVNSISSYLNEQINSHESTPLTGKTYDLSQNGMFTKLVVDIGRALGATITNSPVDGLVAASIVDGDEMRFGN